MKRPEMKPGDLVQSNLFRIGGSGGYGLVVSPHDLDGYWNVWWAGEPTPNSQTPLGLSHGDFVDIHEDDIVVVSAGTNK